MTQVDDWETVAQVITAANQLEEHRTVTYVVRIADGDARTLWAAMQRAQSKISAPVQFLFATIIIEAIHRGITSPIPPNTSNQLYMINRKPEYRLSKIVQLCTQWASAKEVGRQNSQRLITKIVEVIKLWKHHFSNEPEVVTFVSWPRYVGPLNIVTDYELTLPKDIDYSTNIKLIEGRLLRHATSTVNARQIIKGIENQQITFTNSSTNPGTTPPLVWCGVVLNEDEVRNIPENPKRHVLDNRYGSVIFEFSIESTSHLDRDKPVGYVFGTRKFWYEYSQTILIPESSSPSPPNHIQFGVINDDGDQITPLKMVETNTFDWELGYSANGEWTHPELVFVNELKVPVSEIKISFTGHSCPTQKMCYDCKNNITTKKEAKDQFKVLMDSAELTEDVKSTLRSAFSSDDYFEIFESQDMEHD